MTPPGRNDPRFDRDINDLVDHVRKSGSSSEVRDADDLRSSSRLGNTLRTEMTLRDMMRSRDSRTSSEASNLFWRMQRDK